MTCLRYKIKQPNALDPLRGSIHADRVYKPGDLIYVPRGSEGECWRIVAVEADPDPAWADVLVCEETRVIPAP